jgi:hypothetical protein
LMVTALAVALLHLHVCMLHALRAVAINAAMRLHPRREVPDKEVHVRSHIRCRNNIQKAVKNPSAAARSACYVVCLSAVSSPRSELHATLMQSYASHTL